MRLVRFSAPLLVAPAPGSRIDARPSARAGGAVGFVAALVVAGLAASIAPVAAASSDRPVTVVEHASEADGLRQALATAPTAEAATRVRQRLDRLRTRSGSATADLLTARAGAARAAGDVAATLDLLDAAIAVAPDWAGGRHMRGLVHVGRGALGPAATDLDAAVRLDPYDATALFILAALRERGGDKAAALNLIRRAVVADPNLPGLTETAARLTLEVEGQPL